MESLSGNWVGEISGTNTGKLFAEIQQTGNQLSGIARINDPTYGIVLYKFTGKIVGKKIRLDMTPDDSTTGRQISQTLIVNSQPMTVQYSPVNYGDIVANIDIQPDQTLSGKWTSTLGTGGTVFLRNDSLIEGEKNKYLKLYQIAPF